ncbi:MAG: potassium transporter TrkH [Rickettsiales bacterium]|jgi:trk system potassium uptake protein TrkH|nr:potassium transporter TrkH [Rickettsiales bacterium]
MSSYRPVLLVIGTLMSILSVAMIIPAILDLYLDNPDWKSFVISALITCFTGVSLVLTNQGNNTQLTIRQTFLLTTLSWVVVPAFSALPFVFANLDMSYTDGMFEAMSGLTTTGSTVMTGLDAAPPGILLWRALLHGLGGIGIIVMALAILPMLKIGGMQLFRTESSDKSDKVLPRARQVAGAMTGIYVFLIFTATIFLWLGGMTELDALCHAIGAVSTGGFGNHDSSVAYYNSPLLEGILIVFMFLGALPFVLFVQILRGKEVSLLWQDEQVRWFILIIIFSVGIIVLWLVARDEMPFLQALRHTLFNVVSIITTTGFASVDYGLWGTFVVAFLFMLTVVGGCTGSTSGGIKIFRFNILYNTANSQVAHLVSPNAIYRAYFNGKPVTEEVKASVMSFFILFAFCYLVLAVLLSLTGLDFLTSMSGAATALANVGPGFGDVIGPVGNFSTLNDPAKWFLTAGMLIGRLEIFTVLVLFTPQFWRD